MKLSLKTSPEIMLTGSPLKSIALFGLPIVLGNVFQQLYSMVDSIVVGNFNGSGALAAVGTSAVVCNCLVMACSGFSMGASVVVAQQFGADKRNDIKTTISTTFLFLTALSVLITAVCLPIIPAFARLINIPADIIADSVTYMRIYVVGLIFLMLYNFFAAILRALGDSVTPLIFLIISSLLNIAGDLFFVVKLGMGVPGVAWATVISQAVSVLLCIVYVMKKSEYFKFKKGEFKFDREIFRYVLRMGIPAALQGSISNVGFILVQSLVNSFGTINIAAYTAANKMEMFSMLPIGGFTQAYAVYVGQNMGAGDVKRTKEGLRVTVIFLTVVSIVCSVIMFIIGPQLVSLFLNKNEANAAEVIARGAAYMRTFCPFLIFHAFMQAYVSVLRGSGDSVMTMACSMFDLGMRVLMAYMLSVWIGIGFMGCAWAIPIGWFSSALMGFLRYRGGKWQHMTVVRKEAASEV